MTFSTYQYDLEYRYGHYDRYVAEKYQSHYCVPKIVKGHKSVPNFSITPDFPDSSSRAIPYFARVSNIIQGSEAFR